jgi:aminocarboxymuconate-semialdehyde decarboxylase
MDRTRVDVQAISVVPFLFRYELEPGPGREWAHTLNEDIARVAAAYPDRFVGLATLPLQDPAEAAAELRWAMREAGLRGAAIGTNARGANLDDGALEPLWTAAEELGAFVFVHPERVAAAERLERYYLINLLGNPLDTSIAIASVVLGGVIERHPRLVLCFAHGGGFIPYQRGRLVHGWEVRAEPRQRLEISPAESLRSLYFDTILHSSEALAYLVRVAGADHVLLGSDFPFDMGPAHPVDAVEEVVSDLSDRDRILGGTAARLLGIDAPVGFFTHR